MHAVHTQEAIQTNCCQQGCALVYSEVRNGACAALEGPTHAVLPHVQHLQLANSIADPGASAWCGAQHTVSWHLVMGHATVCLPIHVWVQDVYQWEGAWL